MMKTVLATAFATLIFMSPATADAISNFQIDTFSLDPSAGPYALDLFFIDGGDGPTNTATLSIAGGGSATLQDTFFTEQQLGFSAGPLLLLQLDMTTNPDLGAFASPDEFSIALLQNGVQIPTTDPTGGNALISVSLPVTPDGSPEVVFTDSAGGDVQSGFAENATPEPSTFGLVAGVLVLLCLIGRKTSVSG